MSMINDNKPWLIMVPVMMNQPLLWIINTMTVINQLVNQTIQVDCMIVEMHGGSDGFGVK